MVASVFGEISPKIRIRKVKIPVAIPAPMLPQRLTAKVVAREDAERFTMLFPIKMALNNLPESSVIARTCFARLSPASARERRRILFTVVSAVSAEEKNADKISKMARIISETMSPVSKNKSPQNLSY